MFTVELSVNGGLTESRAYTTCSAAWKRVAHEVALSAELMEDSTETGDPFDVANIRMAYMINTVSEVEYCNITIA